MSPGGTVFSTDNIDVPVTVSEPWSPLSRPSAAPRTSAVSTAVVPLSGSAVGVTVRYTVRVTVVVPSVAV